MDTNNLISRLTVIINRINTKIMVINSLGEDWQPEGWTPRYFGESIQRIDLDALSDIIQELKEELKEERRKEKYAAKSAQERHSRSIEQHTPIFKVARQRRRREIAQKLCTLR